MKIYNNKPCIRDFKEARKLDRALNTIFEALNFEDGGWTDKQLDITDEGDILHYTVISENGEIEFVAHYEIDFVYYELDEIVIAQKYNAD